MNIYQISQSANNGWDTYDSAIVVANTEEEAKYIHPSGDNKNWHTIYNFTWVRKARYVNVEYVGIADEKYTENQVILASFNAG